MFYYDIHIIGIFLPYSILLLFCPGGSNPEEGDRGDLALTFCSFLLRSGEADAEAKAVALAAASAGDAIPSSVNVSSRPAMSLWLRPVLASSPSSIPDMLLRSCQLLLLAVGGTQVGVGEPAEVLFHGGVLLVIFELLKALLDAGTNGLASGDNFFLFVILL